MTITCSLYTNGRWHDADGGATFTRSHPLNAEAPSTAAAGFVTDCHPSTGVMICVSVPAVALIAPSVSHVAVTITKASGVGMVTTSGSSHFVEPSPTAPLLSKLPVRQ